MKVSNPRSRKAAFGVWQRYGLPEQITDIFNTRHPRLPLSTRAKQTLDLPEPRVPWGAELRSAQGCAGTQIWKVSIPKLYSKWWATPAFQQGRDVAIWKRPGWAPALLGVTEPSSG